MSKVGIVVIGYKNSESLSRLLCGVNNAEYDTDNVELIISMDYHPSGEAYAVACDFEWKHGIKHVILNNPRLGLRNHIIKCGSYMKEYGLDAIVVLEDDIFPARDFYVYAVNAVNQYIGNPNIAGISLYSWNKNRYGKMFRPIKTEYDAYFMKFAQSWGQVWLKGTWDDFLQWYEDNKQDFEESISLPEYLYYWGDYSWLKYHIRYCLEMNKYFVYPYESKTTCFSEVGEHTAKQSNVNQVEITNVVGNNYRFPELTESVHYDSFYENEDIYTYCGVCKEELTVDIYATKREVSTRYLLTSRIMEYPIVKQWNGDLIPVEQNIIYNIEGTGIYLYDLGMENPKTLSVVTEYISGTQDRFKLLNQYLQMIETGEEYVLSDGLKSIRNVAIYGYGVMGKHLAFMLRRAEIEISYVIDNNSNASNDIRVYKLGDILPKVDVIIVSVLENCDEIKRQLEQYCAYRVIDIREVEWQRGCSS